MLHDGLAGSVVAPPPEHNRQAGRLGSIPGYPDPEHPGRSLRRTRCRGLCRERWEGPTKAATKFETKILLDGEPSSSEAVSRSGVGDSWKATCSFLNCSGAMNQRTSNAQRSTFNVQRSTFNAAGS